jgi:uncharacterized protein
VTLASTHEHPRLANIRLHPIKSLDPVHVSEARIGPAGGLELDRAWALYTPDNRWVNGKRTSAIFPIRAEFTPDLKSVTLSVPGDRRQIPPREFPFPAANEEAAEWFSVYFEQRIIVRSSVNGFPDDPDAHGPTVISTASLQKVCDWFADAGIDLDEARRRFRTTLEIDCVPAFWEDRLFGPPFTARHRACALNHNVQRRQYPQYLGRSTHRTFAQISTASSTSVSLDPC